VIDSFYPRESVRREDLVERLQLQFNRWNDKTVLQYLGRPETYTRQVVKHDVRYIKTGSLVPKEHIWRRTLPAVKGVIEKIGRAKMIRSSNEVWYNLFYPRQTTFDEETNMSPPKPLSSERPLKEGLHSLGLSLDEPCFVEVKGEGSPKKNYISHIAFDSSKCDGEPNDSIGERVREERESYREREINRHEHKRIQICRARAWLGP